MRLKKLAVVSIVVPFAFLAACSSGDSSTGTDLPAASAMQSSPPEEGEVTGDASMVEGGTEEGGVPSPMATVVDPVSGEEVVVGSMKDVPEGGVNTSAGEEICAEIVEAKLTLPDAEGRVEERDMVSRVITLEGAPQEATKDYLANRLNFTVEGGIVVKCTIG